MPPPTVSDGMISAEALHYGRGAPAQTETSPILADARRLVSLLSARHGLDVLWLLDGRSPSRFNDIKRALRASAVTLSERLDDLEEAGLISRRAYAETPPRVEYAITPKGRSVAAAVRALVGATYAEIPAIEPVDEVPEA